MHLLAIETATEALSIALFSDKYLVAESSPKTEVASHCERLLPEIEALLSRHSLSPFDIGAYAVDVGPGSFTSLRVGLATVMGLAFEKKTPVYPVSSLEALALGHEGPEGCVATLIPAGRGMIYGALFEKNYVSLKTVVAESAFCPGDFFRALKSFSKNLVVVGPVAMGLPPDWKNASYKSCSPRARNVGLVALSGRIPPSPIDALRVRYLKEPDLGNSRPTPCPTPLTTP